MSLHAWRVMWLCWFAASVSWFLAFEIYALVTDYRRTLSAAIWHWEKFQPGQPITSWNAFHFLFIGVLFVLDVWLLGHFAFEWWR